MQYLSHGRSRERLDNGSCLRALIDNEPVVAAQAEVGELQFDRQHLQGAGGRIAWLDQVRHIHAVANSERKTVDSVRLPSMHLETFYHVSNV